jgi:hypothetical protein
MKKLMWIVVGIIALIVYLNIGYLFVYSFDPRVQQTAVSNFIYKIVDFYGVAGRMEPRSFNSTIDAFMSYALGMIFWLVLLIFCWAVNLFVMVWDILAWVFAGGFWRYLGWIK